MEKTRSHPIQAEKFLNELIPRTRISKPYPPLFRPLQDAAPNPAFSMTVSKIFDTRRANIALLRIGYLLAFATLGNSFLLNSGLFTVREQLMHPDKEVIKIFWIAHKFPKHMEGIHIITLPKDMRAFLVIFSLATRSSTSQFAIVLPGPTAPGIKVYDFIESELCTGDGTTFLNFTTEKLPDKNYLKDKASAFLAQAYWQEFTNDGYTPRFAP
ncbi:hypothetical protein [Dawidia soli]|uniref:Uncharacterized protein n=1 Tax=Dawidia soli TaxID=2782352 RepID=A0AAP2DDQ3_9BACT|nr:hypothetical protein [Dawidia soli]MBT1688860.1 hypothetical protein [Dawidia soli]